MRAACPSSCCLCWLGQSQQHHTHHGPQRPHRDHTSTALYHTSVLTSLAAVSRSPTTVWHADNHSIQPSVRYQVLLLLLLLLLLRRSARVQAKLRPLIS